ncbi:hypothetical protein D9M71_520920 [compost metagenome]
MEQLAGQQTVHLLGVLHRAHAVALLVEETFQQATQACVVVDHKDLFAFGQGGRIRHGNSGIRSGGHYRPQSRGQTLTIVSRFFPDRAGTAAKHGGYNAALCAGTLSIRPFCLFCQVDSWTASTPVSPKSFPHCPPVAFSRSRSPLPSPCSTKVPPFPSSPVTVKKSPAASTIPSCACWKSACATCASWTSGARRSSPASRNRAS